MCSARQVHDRRGLRPKHIYTYSKHQILALYRLDCYRAVMIAQLISLSFGDA